MAKSKSKAGSFTVKVLPMKEAQREFALRRARGSKYDEVLHKVEALSKDKVLFLEGMNYSEVTALRKRIAELLGGGFSVKSAKADKKNDLFNVLIQRKK